VSRSDGKERYVATIEQEQVPQWQHALNLGGDVDSLRTFAREMEAEPSKGLDPDFITEVEDHFKRIVNGLWAVDPSDFPNRLTAALTAMPGEMYEWFTQFCAREGVKVPRSHYGGGPVKWVISPTS
jgi:hypothetical protein